jgi:hypothetical protein
VSRSSLFPSQRKTGNARGAHARIRDAMSSPFAHQQDSFSHAGFGLGAGHLGAGHGPGKTYNDVPKANLMAGDTYTRLTDAMYKIQRSGIIVPWDKIAPYVDRFTAERDPRVKYGILDEIVTYIEGYRK